MSRTLESVLFDLGEMDPLSIKEALLAQGYRGYRRQPRDCPMAKYLSDQVGIPYVTTRWHCFPEDHQVGKITELPGSVQIFIYRFDAGEWPDLEDHERN